MTDAEEKENFRKFGRPGSKRRFKCVDCHKSTLHGEYYMVRNKLWTAAGMEPCGGMLCLACLERRIGRELILNDFTAQVPSLDAWERHVANRRATPDYVQGDLFDDLDPTTNTAT